MLGALLNRYSFDSVVPDLIRDPFFKQVTKEQMDSGSSPE